MTDTTMNPDTLEVDTEPWLEKLMKNKCGFENIRDFQLRHGLELIKGHDVFLVIAPGMGKTTVLLAPLLAAQEKGESGIAICIVPTKLLAEQTADIAFSRGIRALAINQDTCEEAARSEPKRSLFDELASGKDVRLAVMSPQMLQGTRVDRFLSKKRNKDQVRWLFIDEVHLLQEDSTDWRAAYGGIKDMRSRLGSSTVWAAVTGTATPTHAAQIALKLGFKPGHYINARYDVDRPHIKYITRFMDYSHTGDELLDASFLIDPNITSPKDIQSTLFFCDHIGQGAVAIRFFDRLLATLLPNFTGVVMPYNSIHSREDRRQFIMDFIDGSTLRIGVCTDTCTYGLDIPNVRRVVIYGLCDSFETEKQRLCRAGRDGLPATAYSIVPNWVRERPEEEITTTEAKKNADRRNKLPEVVQRWHNPTVSQCPRKTDLEYNGQSFTGNPIDNCCCMHDPDPELEHDRRTIEHWVLTLKGSAEKPAKPSLPRSDGTHRALEKKMMPPMSRILRTWRGNQWAVVRESCRDKLAIDFLTDSTLDRIVKKAHICTTVARLEKVIGSPEWPYLGQFGESLVKCLGEAMSGFDEIYRDRKRDYISESDSATSSCDSDTDTDADNNGPNIGVGLDSQMSTSQRGPRMGDLEDGVATVALDCKLPVIDMTNHKADRQYAPRLTLRLPAKRGQEASALGESVLESPSKRPRVEKENV